MQLDALQYGALGALILVLAGAFILIKFFLDKTFEQSDSWFSFVKEEITKANVERAGQMEAWYDTIKDSVEASVLVAGSLREINKTLENYGRQFENQSEQFNEILQYIKGINGGSK